MFQQP